MAVGGPVARGAGRLGAEARRRQEVETAGDECESEQRGQVNHRVRDSGEVSQPSAFILILHPDLGGWSSRLGPLETPGKTPDLGFLRALVPCSDDVAQRLTKR